ncbi:hypothetical protein LWI28_003857 [Acer negundo]|uniref:Uncharacterized protein n=1 Tax=Acer negundo TaxID=4023 RepID=A0AAD5J3U9_ACENE|nr:hypothetical protein LWI28_003857 [Acer negundo]
MRYGFIPGPHHAAQEQHYRHFEQLPPQPQTSPLIIICSNGLYLAVRSNFNHERPLHVFDFASNSLKFRFTPPINGSSTTDMSKRSSKSSTTTAAVVFSTLVAVCGSFCHGCASGYSSPAESGIMEDLGLSVATYSVFGSIETGI